MKIIIIIILTIYFAVETGGSYLTWLMNNQDPASGEKACDAFMSSIMFFLFIKLMIMFMSES